MMPRVSPVLGYVVQQISRTMVQLVFCSIPVEISKYLNGAIVTGT
jgi:hypothetical protein